MKDHPYLQLKGFLSFLILHELAQKSLCGDDLANKIGGRKGSKLTPGTIYPALKDLRKHKLIKQKKYGRKKYYTLSDGGRTELDRLYVLFSNYFIGLKQHIKRNSSSIVANKNIKNKGLVKGKEAVNKRSKKPLIKYRSFYHG